MKMKTALILGAGIEQVLAIRQAQSLGYRVIAFDGNPDAAGLSVADEHEVVDIRQIGQVIQKCADKVIDGVFCHGVEIQHVVARVASHLGLPSLCIETADISTNKVLRINRLNEFGIPVAQFRVVSSKKMLESAAQEVGFPLVLKPEQSSGSRGVQVVEELSQLEQAWRDAMQYSENGVILLEELLSGPEISTEALVHDGKIYTFAFADRNYSRNSIFHPYFVEDGINFPSVLSTEIQKQVIETTERAIRCLGIDFGSAKGDVIIDKGVPKIIEIACRSSGGWFGAGSIPLATGVNMLKPLIQMAMGDIPDLDSLNWKKKLGCAQRYLIPIQDGIVESVSGIESAKCSEGVKMSEFFLPEPGTYITKARNHSQRFGQIICTAEIRELAIELCESAIKKIEVKIKAA